MTHTRSTIRSTTVICVRKDNRVAMACDGQVSQGNTIMKANANKIRRIDSCNAVAGFAGSTADALTLYERLENKLEQYPSQLARACIELAKEWRTDKYLRKLEALMAVADKNNSFILSGNGDVFEPDDCIIAIGSGGPYALAASRALYSYEISAEEIVKKAMSIAADICVFSNHNIKMEVL